MRFEATWPSIFLIFGGFLIGYGLRGVTASPKPAITKPPQTIQWIGRLTAGDGQRDGAVFMCREIEIGLGDKGELLWRRVNALPPARNAATNAEAK